MKMRSMTMEHINPRHNEPKIIYMMSQGYGDHFSIHVSGEAWDGDIVGSCAYNYDAHM